MCISMHMQANSVSLCIGVHANCVFHSMRLFFFLVLPLFGKDVFTCEKNALGEYICDNILIGDPPQRIPWRLGSKTVVSDCMWLSPVYISRESWSFGRRFGSFLSEVVQIGSTRLAMDQIKLSHECIVAAGGDVFLNDLPVQSVFFNSEEILHVILNKTGENGRIVFDGLGVWVDKWPLLRGIGEIEFDPTICGIELPIESVSAFEVYASRWKNSFRIRNEIDGSRRVWLNVDVPLHKLSWFRVFANGSKHAVPWTTPVSMNSKDGFRPTCLVFSPNVQYAKIGDALLKSVASLSHNSEKWIIVANLEPARTFLERSPDLKLGPLFRPPVWLKQGEDIKLIWKSANEPVEGGGYLVPPEGREAVLMPLNGSPFSQFRIVNSAIPNAYERTIFGVGKCICKVIEAGDSLFKFQVNDPTIGADEFVCSLKVEIVDDLCTVTCTQETVEKLNVVEQIRPKNAPEDVCCICHESLVEGAIEVHPLGCMHCYHPACMNEMYETRQKCAFCRSEIAKSRQTLHPVDSTGLEAITRSSKGPIAALAASLGCACLVLCPDHPVIAGMMAFAAPLVFAEMLDANAIYDERQTTAHWKCFMNKLPATPDNSERVLESYYQTRFKIQAFRPLYKMFNRSYLNDEKHGV